LARKSKETDDYYYIGQLKVDHLCISEFSHDVIILSCYDPLKVVYKCTQNNSLFLEAIIVAAKFLENCGMEDNLDDNEELVCKMADRCSHIAGGKLYLNFY
jgi:hypothetical protein